jgi:hypothetical protein
VNGRLGNGFEHSVNHCVRRLRYTRIFIAMQEQK